MIDGVTVYCLTYNHREYIENTLEGFVNQNVSFPFKVIVHDDASTDGTRDIIKRYAEKYPEIIYPVFQTENQYSKVFDIYVEFIRPLIDTKYTAICEGDDYWCDSNKIRMQYDYMESNPNCSLCVHNTEKINEKGRSINRVFNQSKEDVDYSAEDVIAKGPAGLFHTSSFFYRTELRDRKPDVFLMKHVGDYPLSVFLSCNGHVHYFGRVMSKYRVDSRNSWSKMINGDSNRLIAHFEDEIQLLIRMDKYTELRYHSQFQALINKDKFEKSVIEVGLFNSLKCKENRDTFKHYALKARVKHILRSWGIRC